MKRYTLLFTLAALLAAGCQTDPVTPENGPSGGKTRVAFLVSISVKDLGVDITPMQSRASAPKATDLWYAVFDAATGRLIPAESGTTRHLTLENGVVPAFEELLPTGSYRLSFLVMTEGGDTKAVQSPTQWTDPWLKASADGTVPGDFLFGQSTAEVRTGPDNTVTVELQRAVAQLRVNLAFSTTEQAAAVEAVALSVTEGVLSGTLGANGIYGGTAAVSGVNMSQVRECFVLTPATQRQPCKGNVQLTLAGSDGRKYVRAYPFSLELKAGERSTFDLTLDLAYDALDILTSADRLSEARMFSDTEPVPVMQNEQRRSFYVQTPLRIIKKDNTSNYIQFYSLKGIGRTEIYARIRTTKDYFKVYELDTIKPLGEIVMPSKLLSGEVLTSVTQEGKIVRVPTAGLTWDHFEFLCVNTTSDYWKHFGNGTAKPNFKFRIYGRQQITLPDYDNDNNFKDVTPDIARKMVAMALNWAHMFSTDLFRAKLEAGGPYHIDVLDEKQPDRKRRITSSPEDMFSRILQVEYCTFVLQHPNAGVYGQGGAGMGMICIPADQYTNQIPTDNPGYGSYFVKFHELGHVMGFPDNYDAPAGSQNTITNYGNVGWPKVCDDSMLQLANDGALPVNSIRELDTLFD